MSQNTRRPKIYMLIGLPGSGKSTWAQKKGLPILSSDAMREELSGSAHDQDTTSPQDIFKALDARLEECLKNGQDVIYDALNTEPQHRRPRLKHWNEVYKAEITGVLFTTPTKVAKERNKQRDRVVPDTVIEKHERIFDANPLDTSKDWFDHVIKVDEHGNEKELYHFEREKRRVIDREEHIITREGEMRPRIRK